MIFFIVPVGTCESHIAKTTLFYPAELVFIKPAGGLPYRPGPCLCVVYPRFASPAYVPVLIMTKVDLVFIVGLQSLHEGIEMLRLPGTKIIIP